MSTIFAFLKTKFGMGVVALTVVIIAAVILIRSYGNTREDEGYRQGAADSTAVWGQRYSALVTAKTRAESLLTISREQLPEIRYRFRDRAVPDRAAVDSAFQAGTMQGRTCEDQLALMWPLAYARIDTTQYTKDSLKVRTTGDVYFDPPTRMWDIAVQAAPSITRTWLIRQGYILPGEVIENDFALELMLGSPVKSPALRFSPSVWYDVFGIGVDFEARRSPVLKIGGRIQW